MAYNTAEEHLDNRSILNPKFVIPMAVQLKSYHSSNSFKIQFHEK
jgi:hypothetical protein